MHQRIIEMISLIYGGLEFQHIGIGEASHQSIEARLNHQVPRSNIKHLVLILKIKQPTTDVSRIFPHSTLDVSLTMAQNHFVRTKRHDTQLNVVTTDTSNAFMKQLVTILPLLLDLDDPQLKDVCKAFARGDLPKTSQLLDDFKNNRAKNIQEEQTKRIMTTFLSKQKGNKEQNIISNISVHKGRYEDTLMQAAATWAKIEELENQLNGLKQKDLNTDDIEDIIKMKSLKSIKAFNNHGLIRFEFFLPASIDSNVLNHMLTSNRHNMFKEEKKFFSSLFLSSRYQLYINQSVGHFSRVSDSALPVQRINNENAEEMYTKNESPHGICNYHIHHYNCWGDNPRILLEAYNANDFLYFFNLLASVVSGMNIADDIVMEKFLSEVFHNSSSTVKRPSVYDKEEDKWISLRDLFERCHNNETDS